MSLESSTKKIEKPNLLIRRCVETDLEAAAKLFAESFCQREPIALHQKEAVDNFYNRLTLEATQNCLKENLSFVCLDTNLPENEQMVGVRLCDTLDVKYYLNKDLNDLLVKGSLGYVRNMLTKLTYDWIKSHPEFDENVKVLHNVALGTKDGYEGFGIATKLATVAINNAKSLNYQWVLTQASAAGSQWIFKNKLKFQPKNEIVYCEHEIDGVKLFETLVEPRSFLVLEKNLDEWEHVDIKEYKSN